MNRWWDDDELRVAVHKHDRNYSHSEIYVEPYMSSPQYRLLSGKVRARGSESNLAIPVMFSRVLGKGDYVVFTNSGPFTKEHPELHGWITKILIYNDDELVAAPALGQLDGTDTIYSPQSMVLKDFFLIAPHLPILAGWEKDVPQLTNAEVCPYCRGPITCFRLAPYCATCNKVQVTDTWGKVTTWEPVL